MDSEGRKFECFDDEGNVIECEVIMTYLCEKNQKNYVFYTDNKYDNEGNLNVYASIYLGEDNGNMILESIVDENEWRLLDDVLEETRKGVDE